METCIKCNRPSQTAVCQECSGELRASSSENAARALRARAVDLVCRRAFEAVPRTFRRYAYDSQGRQVSTWLERDNRAVEAATRKAHRDEAAIRAATLELAAQGTEDTPE